MNGFWKKKYTPPSLWQALMGFLLAFAGSIFLNSNHAWPAAVRVRKATTSKACATVLTEEDLAKKEDYQKTLRMVLQAQRDLAQGKLNSLAANYVIQKFQPLALKMVKYSAGRRSNYRFDEALQEANMAIWRAIRKFNPNKGASFHTYASMWLAGMLQRYFTQEYTYAPLVSRFLYSSRERRAITPRVVEYIMNSGELPSVPDEKVWAQFELIAAEVNSMQETEENIEEGGESEKIEANDNNNEEKKPKVTALDVAEVFRAIHSSTSSFDAPVRNKEGFTLENLLADESPNALQKVEDETTSGRLRKLFLEFRETLDRPLWKDIFDERIYNPNDSDTTLEEIADRYGISRERVRQVQKKVHARLVDFIKKTGLSLEDFYSED